MNKLDTLHLLYNEIIKYLDYMDYLNFNILLNKSEIIEYTRKCIYCNNVPYFPTSINYSTKSGFITNSSCNGEVTKCVQSLINPSCLFCLIKKWMNKFNLKTRQKRKISGFECPYGCCKLKTNTIGDYLLNFNNIGTSHLNHIGNLKFNLNKHIYFIEAKKFHSEYIWKNIYDKKVIRCKFCNKEFNKFEYLISHYKNDSCKRVKCKYYGYISDSSDSSDSDKDEVYNDYLD